MCLIEKLGGYEEAKKIRVAFDATHYCISRKSMMKVFPKSTSLDAMTNHFIKRGFSETRLEDDDLVTQGEINDALLKYREKNGLR